MLSWARGHRGLLACLGLVWAVFLGIELAGRDFGVYADELTYTVPGVRQMVQTGRLLPGRYGYPSLFFYTALTAVLPDAVAATRQNVRAGVHASTALSVRDSLLSRIDAPKFITRVRAVFMLAASLTVFWVGALAFLVWRSRVASVLAAALWASSWEVAYHGRWAAPQPLMGQLAWAAVLAAVLALQTEASPARRRLWLRGSAVAAALSAATLWNGGAALLATVAAFILLRRRTESGGRAATVAPLAVLALFGGVFIAVCPAVLLDPVRFFGDLLYDFVAYARHGSLFAAKPGVDQLSRIGEYLALVAFSPSAAMSAAVLTFAGIGGALVWRARRVELAPAGAFFLLQLLFLSAIGTFYARNQLVLLPGIAVLAAGGFETIRSWIAARARVLALLLWLLPIGALGWNARFAWNAVRSIRHRDLLADAVRARDVVHGRAGTVVLPSSGVSRLLGPTFSGCAGLGAPCPTGAPDSLVVVRASELLFGESTVSAWDSSAATQSPGHFFEGFPSLTRAELLSMSFGGGVRPGRQSIVGSFGPADVNFIYYPNWITSDRVVLLTPRSAAEAICGARQGSESAGVAPTWPTLQRMVCSPLPVR